MILIDTSAWIEFFRGTGSAAAAEVRRLLTEQPDRIVMCEPIAMEILSGALDDQTFVKLERLVNGLASLPVDQSVDYRTAAAIYRNARRGGRSIRSVNDCLIAAIAVRHGAEVFHQDEDYDVIAAITPLESRSLR